MKPEEQVTVIVPLRDEAHNLERFFRMLDNQTLRPARIVIADGMSTDGSAEKLRQLETERDDLTVVLNPRRVVPTGLNAALSAAETEIVARMDLHAEYSSDYLATVVRFLVENPAVVGVGGAMATAGRGPWGRAIASTLSRSFGLGGARHRVGGNSGPIDHVFSGCYRRAALVAVGGWDERFLANEDFEADARLRRAGGSLMLHSEATSTWFVRETPGKLAKQMFRYGFYKGLTLSVHPESLRARQMAPVGLVALLTLSSASPRLRVATLLPYVLTSSGLGAYAAWSDGASAVRGAAVPAIVHLSWGVGAVTGLAHAFGRRGGRIEPWSAETARLST